MINLLSLPPTGTFFNDTILGGRPDSDSEKSSLDCSRKDTDFAGEFNESVSLLTFRNPTLLSSLTL